MNFEEPKDKRVLFYIESLRRHDRHRKMYDNLDEGYCTVLINEINNNKLTKEELYWMAKNLPTCRARMEARRKLREMVGKEKFEILNDPDV